VVFSSIFVFFGGGSRAKCINNEFLRTVCSFRMESIIEVPERSPPPRGERFEILTVVLMVIHVLWDMTPL
jgi:hypothetical protein